jgi:hypothetical protein
METLEGLQYTIKSNPSSSHLPNLNHLHLNLSRALSKFAAAHSDAIRDLSSIIPLSTPVTEIVDDPFAVGESEFMNELMFKRYYYYGINLSSWVSELLSVVDMVRSTKQNAPVPSPSFTAALVPPPQLSKGQTIGKSTYNYKIWRLLTKLRSPAINSLLKLVSEQFSCRRRHLSKQHERNG